VLLGAKHIGEFGQMGLLAISRLGSDAYGISVLRELETRADPAVSRGGLYLVLERMVQKGYLSTRLGESTPGRGSRAKRFFSLTEAGKEALRVSGRALLTLWDSMEFLFEDGA
jgi:DNA-binding PadR family transcriptional regulator